MFISIFKCDSLPEQETLSRMHSVECRTQAKPNESMWNEMNEYEKGHTTTNKIYLTWKLNNNWCKHQSFYCIQRRIQPTSPNPCGVNVIFIFCFLSIPILALWIVLFSCLFLIQYLSGIETCVRKAIFNRCIFFFISISFFSTINSMHALNFFCLTALIRWCSALVLLLIKKSENKNYLLLNLRQKWFVFHITVENNNSIRIRNWPNEKINKFTERLCVCVVRLEPQLWHWASIRSENNRKHFDSILIITFAFECLAWNATSGLDSACKWLIY